MTGLWAYPWCFSADTIESSLDSLVDAGIDRLKLAAHYHSVRTFDPKTDNMGFETFPGGCLFDPDESYYGQTPIEPPRNDDCNYIDTFDEVVSRASSRGIDLDAWVVCLHGTRLASNWPEYRIEDAFGDGHTHSLCPSHPEVRKFFAGIVANVAQYDIDRIDLESIGFPSVLHRHGASFGHHKDYVVTNRASEFLLSQCFCDGCRAASDGRVDLAAAQDVVTRLCRRYLTQPDIEMPPLSQLLQDHPTLQDLFEFRASVIEKLLDELATASGKTDLSYYVADGGAYTPKELWPSGVTADALTDHLDDVTVLCYTDHLETIDDRIAACQDVFDHEVNVGLTLDPDIIEDRTHWDRIVTRVSDAIEGDVCVYNYDLMTPAHLEWVAEHDSKQLI